MSKTVQLDELTIEEKLQLLEDLQVDLHRNEAHVPSPEWHGEVLAERQKLIESSQATFLDWEDAKKRLRKRIDESRHPEQS